MNYENKDPNLTVESPAPGHYIIKGYAHAPVDTAGGRVALPTECYITPEVPTELLEAIIEDRKGAVKETAAARAARLKAEEQAEAAAEKQRKEDATGVVSRATAPHGETKHGGHK